MTSFHFELLKFWIFFHLNLLSKAQVELSSNEIPFSYQNWTKKLMFFHLYFDSYLWSSFEYKKMVRELSKIVHKFTEAEQFVFISEQSAKTPRFLLLQPAIVYLRVWISVYTGRDFPLFLCPGTKKLSSPRAGAKILGRA